MEAGVSTSSIGPDEVLRSQAAGTVPTLASFKELPIIGIVGTIVFAAAALAALLYWDPAPEDIKASGESLGVILGPFGFAGPIIANTFGYGLPIILAWLAAGMVFIGLFGLYKVASPFDVACPGCGTEYRLGTARSYKFACPECFAIVYGKRGSDQRTSICAYCQLEYSGPQDGGLCPACLHEADSAKQRPCKHCQSAVPKDARICTNCNTWLAGIESPFLRFPDVALFAAPARLAYTASATKIALQEASALDMHNLEGRLDNVKLWDADDVARRLWSCSMGAYAMSKFDRRVPEDLASNLKNMIEELRVKVSPFFDEGLNKYAEEKKESIGKLLTAADAAVLSASERGETRASQ